MKPSEARGFVVIILAFAIAFVSPILFPQEVSPIVGTRVSYPHTSLSIIDAVNTSKTIACGSRNISLLQCTAIIDMTCSHIYRRAFWHRVIDCLSFEYAGIKQALDSQVVPCFVGFANRAEFYSTLVTHFENDDPRLICDDLPSKSGWAPGRSWGNDTLARNDSMIPVFKVIRDNSLSTSMLAEDLYDRWVNSTSNMSKTILLVKRSRTRTFNGNTFEALKHTCEKIAHEVGRSVQVYDGSESVEKTIQLFYSADIVLAFHGAAAANMLFARPGTYFIEITTYLKSDDSKKFRSNVNKMKEKMNDINPLAFRIPLDRAPALNVSEVDKLENPDAFVKDHFSNISLRKSDLDNLETMLTEALLHVHRLSEH